MYFFPHNTCLTCVEKNDEDQLTQLRISVKKDWEKSVGRTLLVRQSTFVAHKNGKC